MKTEKFKYEHLSFTNFTFRSINLLIYQFVSVQQWFSLSCFFIIMTAFVGFHTLLNLKLFYHLTNFTVRS